MAYQITTFASWIQISDKKEKQKEILEITFLMSVLKVISFIELSRLISKIFHLEFYFFGRLKIQDLVTDDFSVDRRDVDQVSRIWSWQLLKLVNLKSRKRWLIENYCQY